MIKKNNQHLIKHDLLNLIFEWTLHYMYFTFAKPTVLFCYIPLMIFPIYFFDFHSLWFDFLFVTITEFNLNYFYYSEFDLLLFYYFLFLFCWLKKKDIAIVWYNAYALTEFLAIMVTQMEILSGQWSSRNTMKTVNHPGKFIL